ncbi:hypothetical protein BESB_053320 [Besnoitia besnoiti]|uniref:Transmembrane protein n=1 Tax=Besnoitia besnoiti TaxID=94643 RepID=A0A2A9MHD8_BESBE|nr:hypothetical protein BESB_053320 [Besnoitia besnoiti]PFH35681.1 hypothetical protein BESB_053320 [Besnoitia besnoiti]
MDTESYSRQSSTLSSSSFLSPRYLSGSQHDEDLPLPPPSTFRGSWAVHGDPFDLVGGPTSPSLLSPRVGVRPATLVGAASASSASAHDSSIASKHRVRILCVCLVLMCFASSLYRSVEPLQALMSSSPRFLAEEGLQPEDARIVLTNGFALSSGLGLLVGLFLTSVIAPRTSRKILGLLCVASAGAGLLLAGFAETTAALIASVMLMGLTCAMTNALLPVVTLFREKASAVYTLVCAADFASVIPLQIFRAAVEFFQWNPRTALSVYVWCVYPALFVLVFFLPEYPFSFPEEAPIGLSGEDEQRLLSDEEKAENGEARTERRGASGMRGGGSLASAPRRAPAALPDLYDAFPPPLWRLSLRQQLCSLHLYGLSLWWMATAIGSETVRLYYRRALRTSSDSGAHAADTVEHVASWAACFSFLVLPAVYWLLHVTWAQTDRQRLQEIRRLEEAFDADYEGKDAVTGLGQVWRPGQIGGDSGEWSGVIRSAAWSLRKYLVLPRVTPRVLGFVCSALLAVIALLLRPGALAPCAVAVVLSCVLQALAPITMFLILSNTYGPRFFPTLLSLQVVLLASVGLLAPLFQNFLFTALRRHSGALTASLLFCAFVGGVPLLCFHCTPCDEFDAKRVHVCALGLPLALEKHSMAAIFHEAGADSEFMESTGSREQATASHAR